MPGIGSLTPWTTKSDAKVSISGLAIYSEQPNAYPKGVLPDGNSRGYCSSLITTHASTYQCFWSFGDAGAGLAVEFSQAQGESPHCGWGIVFAISVVVPILLIG